MSNKPNGDPGDENSIWAIVPASGIGRRMQSEIPKQYLRINGTPILQLTLERLLSVDQVQGVVVALQANDKNWQSINLDTQKTVLRADGGDERCHSVINALRCLQQQDLFDENQAWVLVHDAVRPCVSVLDIEKLISKSMLSESGGLLATPVRDTIKRQGNDQAVASTVDREGLWHALTPQCFPFKALLDSLVQAEAQGFIVTDESSAMEMAGFTPRLVSGSDKNIKITRPEDLGLAEQYFRKQD